MPASVTSPNIDNYYVGKGILSFQLNSTGLFVDMGNCPKFEFTPKATKLDHFSSRLGTRIKDDTIITTVEGTLNMVLDEWTPENLSLALLGTVLSGEDQFIFAAPSGVRGAIKFLGTNAVGPQLEIVFGNCLFIPTKALSLIGDAWGQIDLDAEVLIDNGGHFGHCQWFANPPAAS